MITNSMYVVVVTHKKIAALNDLMAVIIQTFPHDKFTIVGSEEKGYQFRVLGSGDEKGPRKLAEPFLKKWKPSPEQVISEELAAKMKQDDAEYFASRNPHDGAQAKARDEKLKTVPGTGQPTRVEAPVYETLEEGAYNVP